MTSIAELSACTMFIAGISALLLFALALEVPRHFLVHVLEHRAHGREWSLVERAQSFGFLARGAHLFFNLLRHRFVLLLGPGAAADEMHLQALDRIAERPFLGFVGGAVTARIVRGRMRRGAVGEKLDERRPEAAARTLGSPAPGGL